MLLPGLEPGDGQGAVGFFKVPHQTGVTRCGRIDTPDIVGLRQCLRQKTLNELSVVPTFQRRKYAQVGKVTRHHLVTPEAAFEVIARQHRPGHDKDFSGPGSDEAPERATYTQSPIAPSRVRHERTVAKCLSSD